MGDVGRAGGDVFGQVTLRKVPKGSTNTFQANWQEGIASKYE